MEPTLAKQPRKYTRRSDDERIADLEQKIADLRARKAQQEKKDDPVLKEIPKLQKRLLKFAQLAMDGQRPDLSNSAMAFHASLGRFLQGELKAPRSLPEIEEGQ